ncbi:MAG: hypothetical protein GX575_25720 [Candidatus Anammoximicrobium sp.]|nr:hypothetical protein [Candidatus Anammoximicrobium sp.]
MAETFNQAIERIDRENAERAKRELLKIQLFEVLSGPQTNGSKKLVVEADGPLPGNRFRYDGRVHDMRPVPWKLLAALWERDERNMHDVEEEVWEVGGGSQLKDAMHDLKDFLQSIGYPRYVSKARRSDSLVWKAF